MKLSWEDAIQRQDNKITELREMNAELLRALKYTRLFIGQPTPVSEEIDEIIAKAEKQVMDTETIRNESRYRQLNEHTE